MQLPRAARKAGAAAVALSGAGPSLVAFAPNRHQHIARAMARAFKGAGLKVRTFILEIERQGARLHQPKEGVSSRCSKRTRRDHTRRSTTPTAIKPTQKPTQSPITPQFCRKHNV